MSDFCCSWTFRTGNVIKRRFGGRQSLKFGKDERTDFRIVDVDLGLKCYCSICTAAGSPLSIGVASPQSVE